MSVMDILIDCENQLGWRPAGANIWKARAAQHRILTAAMARRGVTETDLKVAIAWCRRRRQAIRSPLNLFDYIDAARARATEHVGAHVVALEARIDAAIAWEGDNSDLESRYWTTRLLRSVGPHRVAVLNEWHDAGRGPQT